MEKIHYSSEDLHSHHAIGAVIKNNKHEILMQEHVKYGFWTIPIGKVKSEQSVEEGLKQEILEECAIQIEKFKEIVQKDYIYERDGKNVKVLVHLFDILKFKGEVKNNEPLKHKQQIFLSVEKIKNLPYISDSTILYLEQLGIKRGARV